MFRRTIIILGDLHKRIIEMKVFVSRGAESVDSSSSSRPLLAVNISTEGTNETGKKGD